MQEDEYDAERNATRFRIEVGLGNILPPFDEHDMQTWYYACLEHGE